MYVTETKLSNELVGKQLDEDSGCRLRCKWPTCPYCQSTHDFL